MNTGNFWWMVLAFAIVEFVGTIMTVHTGFTWWPVVATALIGAAGRGAVAGSARAVRPRATGAVL
jgi:hypothetical protein